MKVFKEAEERVQFEGFESGAQTFVFKKAEECVVCREVSEGFGRVSSTHGEQKESL